MKANPQLVFCTCPDRTVAEGIADQLVEQRLAACVNIVDEVGSVYRWQGSIEHDRECLLIIKTTAECYNELEKCILKSHPYELPELIALSIAGGSKGYLDWIGDSVGPD